MGTTVNVIYEHNLDRFKIFTLVKTWVENDKIKAIHIIDIDEWLHKKRFPIVFTSDYKPKKNKPEDLIVMELHDFERLKDYLLKEWVMLDVYDFQFQNRKFKTEFFLNILHRFGVIHTGNKDFQFEEDMAIKELVLQEAELICKYFKSNNFIIVPEYWNEKVPLFKDQNALEITFLDIKNTCKNDRGCSKYLNL